MNESEAIAPRPDMLATLTFGRFATTFGTVIIWMILCMELFSFYENREQARKRVKRGKIRYSSLLLLGVTLTGFLTILDAGVLFWLDWTGRGVECNAFSKVTYISFIVMKQLTYLFLYVRMKIVHDALKLDWLPIRALRWALVLASTIGVTGVYYPLIVLYFNGAVVVPEGICAQYSHTPFVVMIFAITDLTLNILLLGLFILPLTRHVNQQQNLDSQNVLRRLARRNLVVSSIMMASTLAMLFFMLQSMLRLNVMETEEPELTSMQVLHTAFGVVDIIINVSLSHVLSGSWVPKRIKRFFTRFLATTVKSSKNTDGPTPNAAGARNDRAKGGAQVVIGDPLLAEEYGLDGEGKHGSTQNHDDSGVKLPGSNNRISSFAVGGEEPLGSLPVTKVLPEDSSERSS